MSMKFKDNICSVYIIYVVMWAKESRVGVTFLGYANAEKSTNGLSKVNKV